MGGAAWTALFAGAGLSVGLGCTTIQPSPLCGPNGQPMLPAMSTKFISIKLDIACYADTGERNKAKLRIESSEWVWTTLAGIASAAVTLLVVETEEPPALPVAQQEGWPVELPLAGTWAEFNCGGVLEPEWCPK